MPCCSCCSVRTRDRRGKGKRTKTLISREKSSRSRLGLEKDGKSGIVASFHPQFLYLCARLNYERYTAGSRVDGVLHTYIRE